MAEIRKAAESVSTTPNGNGATELVNMSRSELVEIAKTQVAQLYDKLFPDEKLAVCATISVMINRRPAPIADAETATRVQEILLRFAETEAPSSRLAEHCRQAAAAIKAQGGAV